MTFAYPSKPDRMAGRAEILRQRAEHTDDLSRELLETVPAQLFVECLQHCHRMTVVQLFDELRNQFGETLESGSCTSPV